MELPVEQAVAPVALPNVPAPPIKKLSFWALMGTSIYTLGINAVWVAFNNIIVPVQVQAATSAVNKTLFVGIIEGLGIGLAVIINIIAGIISDHFTTKRFGRRAPIMLIGAILTAPFLVLGVFLPVTLPLAFASFIGMQIFTNVSSGAFQPTLADFVPENQRGISAGLKGLFTLIGSAVGVIIVNILVSQNQQPAALVVLAITFIGTTLLNIIAMRPYDKTTMAITPLRLGAAVRDMFRLKPISGGFYWFILGSFLIYMALSSFQGYGIYYIEAVLHQNVNAATASAAIFGGVSLLISMVFAVAAGIISDRIGRRNLIIGAVIMGAVVSVLFTLVPQLGILLPVLGGFGVFLIVGSLYSASIGMVQSVDTALTSDLVPLEEAGKYMGIANLAVGVANAAAPPLFGIILFVQGAPTVHSFTAFFIVTAVFFVISTFVMALKVQNR